MKNELNIQLLQQYIAGELRAKEHIAVEELLAKSEQWQDVYEGLLEQQNQEIDVEAALTRLQEQIVQPKINRTSSKTNSSTKKEVNWKWYGSIAAALIGILVLVYGTLEFLRPIAKTSNETAMHSESNYERGFYQEDQIEIISSAKKSNQQSFVPDEIVARELIEEEQFVAPETTEPTIIYPQDISIDNNQALTAKVDEHVYDDFLTRKGYKQIRYTPQARYSHGPNGGSLPNDHFVRIQKDAIPNGNLKTYERETAQNYLARFPFSGIVQVKFIVDEHGKAKNFRTITTPSEEASEVVIDYLKNGTTWSPAVNTNGDAVLQQQSAKASFGNTIYLKLN